MHARDDVPILAYILLKLASRCNIDCSYCYWFRDDDVLAKPPLLTEMAQERFCDKLAAHLRRHSLEEFTILLHGGEPLLFGKDRFRQFMEHLEAIEDATGSRIQSLITTNGLLLDSDWCELFKRFQVGVSVSLDGPETQHDKRRKDFRAKGTYQRVVAGIDCLRASGIEPGIIAVCDPASDSVSVLDHLVETLKITTLDILPPDATHDDAVASIGTYYTSLFDAWYGKYAARGVEVRMLSGILHALLGGAPVSDSIGFAPVHTLTMLTDGSLEPLDVLRIAGRGSTRTSMNIASHTFQDAFDDRVWRNVYDLSTDLCETCRQCEYARACGGGHLAHRWSNLNGYRNPSVYCGDIKVILQHTWGRIVLDSTISSNGRQIPMAEALGSLQSFDAGLP